MPAPARTKTPALAHQKMTGPPEQNGAGLKKNQEDLLNKEEYAAAADLFAQFIGVVDARDLIATYPECIAHAQTLVEEATKSHINDPAAMLRYLVKRQWTPPPRVAAAPTNRHPLADKDGRCMLCGDAIELCNGEHVTLEWSTRTYAGGQHDER